jgi:hypothetical protein
MMRDGDTALERAIIRDFRVACHAARGRHAMMLRHSRLLVARTAIAFKSIAQANNPSIRLMVR